MQYDVPFPGPGISGAMTIPFDEKYGVGVLKSGAPLKPSIDGLSSKKKVAGVRVSKRSRVNKPLEGFESRDIGEKCSRTPMVNGNPRAVRMKSREGAFLSDKMFLVGRKCPTNFDLGDTLRIGKRKFRVVSLGDPSFPHASDENGLECHEGISQYDHSIQYNLVEIKEEPTHSYNPTSGGAFTRCGLANTDKAKLLCTTDDNATCPECLKVAAKPAPKAKRKKARKIKLFSSGDTIPAHFAFTQPITCPCAARFYSLTACTWRSGWCRCSSA